MKPTLHILIMLLLTGALGSCKKDDLEHQDAFNKSYKTWNTFKAASGNAYVYEVNVGSWTGTNGKTTITVQDGKVVKRAYTYTVDNRPNGGIVVREEWTEEENEIGTHTNGAAAITLDEVYQRARTIWLVKRGGADVYFEAKNNGLISSAGYVPSGCQDDCFTGISISSIVKL